jgi:hypothetical protein
MGSTPRCVDPMQRLPFLAQSPANSSVALRPASVVRRRKSASSSSSMSAYSSQIWSSRCSSPSKGEQLRARTSRSTGCPRCSRRASAPPRTAGWSGWSPARPTTPCSEARSSAGAIVRVKCRRPCRRREGSWEAGRGASVRGRSAQSCGGRRGGRTVRREGPGRRRSSQRLPVHGVRKQAMNAAGDAQRRVLRGRLLRRPSTERRSAAAWIDRSVPLGRYCRSSP